MLKINCYFFLNFIIIYNCVLAINTPRPPLGRSDVTRMNLSRERRACETDQIEYRLTKLEVQVAEKAENLRSEMLEGNHRLQSLELQSAEVQTALERFRNELERFMGTSQAFQLHPVTSAYNEGIDKLGGRLDNLNKVVQVVVAALRIVTSDVSSVKNNITGIDKSIRTLSQTFEHLATKQFLINSLYDIKHNYQNQHYVHSHHVQIGSGTPRNCLEILENGKNNSGIYKIQPDHLQKPFMVYCDMSTRGGGWTYIHNRFDGSQEFYLKFHDYKFGFGNIGGEFWLGLEHIHQLTEYTVNELLIELADVDMAKAYAHYNAFAVGSEAEGYSLKVLGSYDGSAGDSLTYHAGSRFSTTDLDQDNWPEGNCAQSHGGAWWYKSCDQSNLNGRYLNGELPDSYLYQGMYWGEFKGAQYSLAKARMMIRPRNEIN